jgi:hypothetical protein
LFYSSVDEGIISDGIAKTTMPFEMIEILMPHKESLEELLLEVYPGYILDIWDSNNAHLTSLTDFTSLRILETSLVMWLGLLTYRENRLKSEIGLVDKLPKPLSRLFCTTTRLGGLLFLIRSGGCFVLASNMFQTSERSIYTTLGIM